jgi:glycosyltransferase involved in cell wall biosynthesis
MHLLVEAFARVHRNHPSWRLRLVGPLKAEQGGGGPKYERELVDRSQGLPVELHGPEFEASKLALIYQSASLFCYPSVAERGEAFGIAPLEAMACGIAPVVSGLECFRDFIAPKENGWVFDHRGDNPAGALAATLDEAMGNPERRAAVAHRAAETARQFSYEKIAQRYLEDFATLLRT